MRVAVIFASLLLIGASPALTAEENGAVEENAAAPWLQMPVPPHDPEESAAAEEEPDEAEADTTEVLLERLAHAGSRREARRIEQRLIRLWSRSGSPTVDLLFRRSTEALEEGKTRIARALLQQVTSIAPEFAEGWHQRATLEAKSENFEDAMLALRHTLALQPKHYGALAELGSILEDFGDETRALAAYRAALEINPYIGGLGNHVRSLTRTVEGQGI